MLSKKYYSSSSFLCASERVNKFLDMIWASISLHEYLHIWSQLFLSGMMIMAIVILLETNLLLWENDRHQCYLALTWLDLGHKLLNALSTHLFFCFIYVTISKRESVVINNKANLAFSNKKIKSHFCSN